MLEKPQINYKNDVIDKRTYDADLKVLPTSLLVNQCLARSFVMNENKVKIFSEQRCFYKFN